MKAIWKNQVIAESDDIINVEGGLYCTPLMVAVYFQNLNNAKTLITMGAEIDRQNKVTYLFTFLLVCH